MPSTWAWWVVCTIVVGAVGAAANTPLPLQVVVLDAPLQAMPGAVRGPGPRTAVFEPMVAAGAELAMRGSPSTAVRALGGHDRHSHDRSD
jgi:hypothetical protein